MASESPVPDPNIPRTFTDDERERFVPDAPMSHRGNPARDNPTKEDRPFWKYMIAHGNTDAYSARQHLGIPYSPNSPNPVFCFDRFGRTETRLPDGRIVFIGGEHEDHYDPDFFIYNDVVVVHRRDEPEHRLPWFNMYTDDMEDAAGGSRMTAESAREARPEDIEIYRYPVEVFPPTDFHSATYYKEEGTGKEYIFIVGGLGYPGSVHREGTATYRLDLEDFSIRQMRTSGHEPPAGGGTERITTLMGDTLEVFDDGVNYVLSLADMRWTRVEPVGRGRRVFWET